MSEDSPFNTRYCPVGEQCVACGSCDELEVIVLGADDPAVDDDCGWAGEVLCVTSCSSCASWPAGSTLDDEWFQQRYKRLVGSLSDDVICDGIQAHNEHLGFDPLARDMDFWNKYGRLPWQ